MNKKLYLVNATVSAIADKYELREGWHCLIWAYVGYPESGEVIKRWKGVPTRASIAKASKPFATGLNELGELDIELCGYSAIHCSLLDLQETRHGV